MKLAFQLLVVDDNPDVVGNAIGRLKDHLDDKGFDFSRIDPPALSGPDWDTFLNQGRSYDLVMIDYNLSQSEMGDVAAKRLRAALPYTDIIFYSAEPRTTLLRLLAQQEVEGVFVAHRQELDDRLVRLADTIIGKVADITHMRGLAMAEVADMDVVMEQALSDALASHLLPSDVVENTVETLRRSLNDMLAKIPPELDAPGLSSLVPHGLVFTSDHKYRSIRRIARKLHDKPKHDLQTLNSFQSEILKKRNILAHAKEQTVAKDGSAVLRSFGKEGNITIDDDWMMRFREALRKHRRALENVCSAIRDEFAPAQLTDDPGKDQS